MLEIAYPTTTKLDKSYNVQYKFTTISAPNSGVRTLRGRALGPKAAVRRQEQDGIASFSNKLFR